MKLCVIAASAVVAAAQHKPFYHLEGSGRLNPICYETTYTDAHYRSEGFVFGACDERFNEKLGREKVAVCDGHSDINVKDCPTKVIDIEIVKLGKQASDEVDASTTTVPPHNPVYHLEAALENVCYETTYIDAHYQENGFALGRCDESYDVIEEKRVEEVCDGHSEINIKYCPTSVIEIDILKMGKSSDQQEQDPFPPHSLLYHVTANQEAVCFETNYTDAHYQIEGFVVGTCDESYTTVLSTDNVEICNGNSEENIKYCPGATINITVVKFGRT